MTTDQIKAKAQAIKEACDKIIDNIPDSLYPKLGAVNWAAVHCDAVCWLPATDDYGVQVAKANSGELAVYLMDELARLGYEVDVVTAW